MHDAEELVEEDTEEENEDAQMDSRLPSEQSAAPKRRGSPRKDFVDALTVFEASLTEMNKGLLQTIERIFEKGDSMKTKQRANSSGEEEFESR